MLAQNLKLHLGDQLRRFVAEGRPVLFLSVGTTAATSFGQLRNELGLEHDFLQVLAQWSPHAVCPA